MKSNRVSNEHLEQVTRIPNNHAGNCDGAVDSLQELKAPKPGQRCFQQEEESKKFVFKYN
jgi:hypothetical protein